MVTISLCMIVKNEEDVLGRCLNCVKDIADEIIIVDTGSTDNTKKIAEKILFRSFEYDTPRAEICCNIGTYYFEISDYNKAIFWYKLASELNKPVNSWGFISHDFWGYIPNVQLYRLLH